MNRANPKTAVSRHFLDDAADTSGSFYMTITDGVVVFGSYELSRPHVPGPTPPPLTEQSHVPRNYEITAWVT